MEYMVNEMRGNQFFPGNCIYIPENYPEDWRERLEAGEIVSYEEDGEQCKIWLEMEEEEEKNMKKTIDLLNEVVAMGFGREQALTDIDASLDSELEERKPLMEEEIPESLYDDILEGFQADKEMNA